MSILEILTKAGVAGAELVALLEAVKLKAPDLAPQVDEWLAKLGTAVGSANLVALAEALPRELASIGRGDFDGRKHPSDVI